MVEVVYFRKDHLGNEMAVPPPAWFNGYPQWWIDLPENQGLYKKDKVEISVLQVK